MINPATLINLLVKGDLFAQRQLLPAGPAFEAEPAAVIRAPLALSAVGTGMLFQGGGHGFIIAA